MLFNSVDFAIFLPLVFFVYWIILKKNLKIQNLFILISSYLFYGWWDYRFLTLIIVSTLVDFVIGKRLGSSILPRKRKLLLFISIFVNLGFLGFFKYFDFFIQNFTSAFSLFGFDIQSNSLNIVLPVGISFYTFQTLSYTIDVYRKKIKPTNDFIAFAAFVGFFPQLVAGPIERAGNLLPQFEKVRKFEYVKAIDGLRQILWGLFKKIVIADNCAEYVNLIYSNVDGYSGSVLLLGSVLFAFQIYGDFSGYSDIAIGTARLFGISLMRNFAYPYFSRDIAEFWRRWHISLTTWFRDYVYIPLGGSKTKKWKIIRNIFIIFIVSGLWHGANWTFIFWGFINALLFIPLMLQKTNRKNLNVVAEGKLFPTIKEIITISLTFTTVVFTWIFFRAENISDLIIIFKNIFSISTFSMPKGILGPDGKITILMVCIFIIVEWIGRHQQFAIQKIGTNWPKLFNYLFYYIITLLIFWFAGDSQQFIYFQF